MNVASTWNKLFKLCISIDILKVMYSVLFERSCTFFLSWSALKNYFGKVLLINFAGRSTEGTAY